MVGETLRTWLKPLFLVLVLGGALFALGQTLDALLSTGGVVHSRLYDATLPSSPGDARQMLMSLIEFLAGLVGLGITVATILVQLSANRYSSRVADLFIADRANIAYFSLAIVTPLYTFWVVNLLENLPWPTSHVFLVLVLVSLNMLLLIPYVNHLFSLLKPEEIIARIRSSIDLGHLDRRSRDTRVDRSRDNLVTSVNQLTDVVLNSITNSDLNLALRSLVAMRSVVVEAVQFKQAAPERWFLVPRAVFRGPAAQQLYVNESHRCWVEFHAMKQYEQIFFQAVQRFPEVTSAIVERTREIGSAAQDGQDSEAVDVCLLFFNTYLRHGMNARDIRTIFHTFHQYRLLGEAVLAGGDVETVVRLAQHFKYYGQQCERKDLPFALEIAAYDLRRLVEKAYDDRHEAVDRLLNVFLEVDRVPEDEAKDLGLRGVRKSQSLLAAFFLLRGDEALARRIQHDMRDERTERMRSIRDELAIATVSEFWEIQARGANFYHVPDDRREHLTTFFGWFQL